MKILKIKDEIPLSNLKKYGFYYSKSTHCWFKDIREDINTYYETYADYIIDNKDKIIRINTYNSDYPIDDTIFILIKEGWTEIVEEYKEYMKEQ